MSLLGLPWGVFAALFSGAEMLLSKVDAIFSVVFLISGADPSSSDREIFLPGTAGMVLRVGAGTEMLSPEECGNICLEPAGGKLELHTRVEMGCLGTGAGT